MATSLPTIQCKVCGYDGESIEGYYDSVKGDFTCQECIERNKFNNKVINNITLMLKFIKKVLE